RDCPSTVLNVSKMLSDQSDATIAINPANTQQMFVASTNYHAGFDSSGINDAYYAGGTSPPLTNGLFFAYSSNGGTSWTTGIMATGLDDTEPGYGLPAAGHFPHAAFDQYGNLFLTYVADQTEFRGVGSTVLNTDGTYTLTDSAAHWFAKEW